MVLPKEVKDKKCIIGFKNVENNLCFWYCLVYSLYKGRIDRLKTRAYELFKQFFGKKLNDLYQGVSIMALEPLEHHFEINVNVYEYQEQYEIMIDYQQMNTKQYSISTCMKMHYQRKHTFLALKH